MRVSEKEPKSMSRARYSPEFKTKVVEEHLKGGKRISEVCREYKLCETVFRRWLQLYRVDLQAASVSQETVSRELREAKQRIEELESALGRSAMEVDFLRRAFKRVGLPFPSGLRP